jgi:hypothetical protein
MTTQNLIFYPGGCYGTFFEWLFNYLENQETEYPFEQTGSSHKFRGNFWNPKEKLFKHIDSEKKVRFSRIHQGLFEKLNQHESCYQHEYSDVLQNDLNFLKKHFNKILIVAYDQESVLWSENNQLEKIYISEAIFENVYSQYGYTRDFLKPALVKDSVLRIKCALDQELKSSLSPFTQENLQGWNKNNIHDFETWELRELLSFYWFTRTDGQVAAWKKIKNSNNDLLFVSISSLKENFIETVLQTTRYIGINNVSIEKLQKIYGQWRPLQHQIDKDELCHKIFNSLLVAEYFDWSDNKLSIVDEAWIQKKLRDQGIGIKCNDLNIFPTNSNDFLRLLHQL